MAAASLLVSLVAWHLPSFAQTARLPDAWVYLDARGVRTFSDIAPPPDIPEKNILRRPAPADTRANAAAAATSNVSAAAVVAAAASAAATNSPRNSGKDPELAKRLQAKAEEENAKKAADAANAKAQDEADKAKRKKSCDNQVLNRSALKSDNRIARINSKGEREFLSDEQRAAELRQAESNIAECAKG
jgi:hypothetical protein